MLSESQREQLEVWARAVLPGAVAYARSLRLDAGAAEDVVQECLYRLLRKADDYDLVRDGARLLFRAISNLCINQATRRQAMASLDTAGADDQARAVEDRLAVLPPDALANQELSHAIAQALARLPEMHRAAMELRALGHSKREIADVLQISESYAGVLVHRARQIIAAEIAPWLG